MKDDSGSGAAGKQRRLADELRANLARRKAQTRSRRLGEADGRSDGIEAASGQPRPALGANALVESD